MHERCHGATTALILLDPPKVSSTETPTETPSMVVFTVCRVGGSAVRPFRCDTVRGPAQLHPPLIPRPPPCLVPAQAELFQNYTTIEYTLRPPASTVPTYLLVVDTVLAEDELGELKKSLQQALSLLPENALVGLITFGTHVQVSQGEHNYTILGRHQRHTHRAAYPLSREVEQTLLESTPAGRGSYFSILGNWQCCVRS
jgi:hypothetical protein